MIERFGQIIYWLGCGIGILSALLVGYLLVAGNENYLIGVTFFTFVGVACWLLGRAVLYVLAGR